MISIYIYIWLLTNIVSLSNLFNRSLPDGLPETFRILPEYGFWASCLRVCLRTCLRRRISILTELLTQLDYTTYWGSYSSQHKEISAVKNRDPDRSISIMGPMLLCRLIQIRLLTLACLRYQMIWSLPDRLPETFRKLPEPTYNNSFQ